MYTKPSLTLLFALAASTSAQTTTPKSTAAQPTGPIVSVLLPGADNLPGDQKMPLVGSVIAAEASATTVVAFCAPGTDENLCGIPTDGMTVTQGPSTAIMSTAYPAGETDDDEFKDIVVTYGWECSIGGKTTAECLYRAEAGVTGSANPSLLSSFNADMTASTSTLQLNATALSDAMFGVTVTAGAEKLEQSGSAASTGSAAGATATPGVAASVEVGGLAVGGAIAAVFML